MPEQSSSGGKASSPKPNEDAIMRCDDESLTEEEQVIRQILVERNNKAMHEQSNHDSGKANFRKPNEDVTNTRSDDDEETRVMRKILAERARCLEEAAQEEVRETGADPPTRAPTASTGNAIKNDPKKESLTATGEENGIGERETRPRLAVGVIADDMHELVPGAYAVQPPRNPDELVGLDSDLSSEPNLSSSAPELSSEIQGLAVANPIDESSRQDLPKAEEYDPEANNKGPSSSVGADAKRLNRKCTLIVFGAVLIVASIVLVLAFTLTKDDAGGLAQTNRNQPKTQAPAPHAASHILSLLPNDTDTIQQIQEDPSSPQAMAYNWMLNDTSLEQHSDKRILQRFALATLYYATNGFAWADNSNWLSYDHHECTWYAKRCFAMKDTLSSIYPNYMEEFNPSPPQPCNAHYDEENKDEETGLYQNLWLDQNNLQGSLPPELFMLTSLKSMSFGLDEELRGTISSHVGRLSHLEGLAIFRMRGAGEIPTEFGLLANMRVLVLGDNQHHGTIPTEIGLLTNMSSFGIRENRQLSGPISNGIPYSSNLRQLSLDGCDLTGSIPSEIGQRTALDWLVLHENRLHGNLPSELGLLTKLGLITANGNALTGALPSQLGELSLSRMHAFGDNQLSGTIPTEFGLLTNLATLLSLEGNALSGTIPSELSNLVSLQELSVQNNNIMGAIPSEFGLLESLEIFIAQNNSLSGTTPEEMAASADVLYIFNVSDNSLLSGTIPEALCNLNGTCHPSSLGGLNRCGRMLGLAFDCSSLLCGCSCSCTVDGNATA